METSEMIFSESSMSHEDDEGVQEHLDGIDEDEQINPLDTRDRISDIHFLDLSLLLLASLSAILTYF